MDLSDRLEETMKREATVKETENALLESTGSLDVTTGLGTNATNPNAQPSTVDIASIQNNSPLRSGFDSGRCGGFSGMGAFDANDDKP